MKKLPYEVPEFLLALTEDEIKANGYATGEFTDEETDFEFPEFPA